MIAIEKTNNTGKILVAVLAMFMIIAGAAVVLSDSSVNAESASILEPDTGDSTKITLENDVTVTDLAFKAGVTTVNLNGHTLTINAATGYLALGVSVTDSSETPGKIVTDRVISISANNVTISKVTVESSYNQVFDIAAGLTGIQFNNVTFGGKATTAVYANDFSTAVQQGNVVFDGCTFNGKALVYTTDKTDDKLQMEIKNAKDEYVLATGSSSGNSNPTVTYTADNTKTADIQTDEASNNNLNRLGLTNDTKFEIIGGTDFNPDSITGDGSVHAGTSSTVTTNTSEVPVTGEDPDSVHVDEYQIPDATTWDQVRANLDATGEATISGNMSPLDEPLEIEAGQVLNINNSTFYGSATISVIGGTLNINNSYVYVGVDVDEEKGGQLNVTRAHTLTADGTGNTDLYVGVGDTLNFSGTIPEQRTVYVYGNLVANNINVAGTIETYTGSSVTLDGTSTISGDFVLNDAKMEISGTVNIRNDANGGADFILNNESEVTVTETGTVNVTKPTAIAAEGVNTLTINDTSVFTVEGTLNITGVLKGAVQDKGTIVFNGTSDNGSISVYNGVTLTVTSVSGELTINDIGAVKDVAGNRYNAANASEGNSIVLNDVRGIKIVETVTSETFESTRYYYSNMDVTGTFAALQSSDSSSIKITSNNDKVTVDGVDKYGEVTISGTAIVGSGVELINSNVLTVTGELSVTKETTNSAGGSLTNNGTITVEGSVLIYDAQIASTVNAVHYTATTVDGVANHYTNFSAAVVAAGEADSDTVTVLGKVSVTENAEIAASTYVSVDAAATLTIAQGVTLTVADGASLTVVGTVDVLGTLVITNTDTGLSYGTLKYDVYTVSGKTATYTSLANALANAQPGDVITISQEVRITGNMTIPEGVTVQTADNSVILEDDVTLTVDGTLAIQNRGALEADGTLVWGTDVRLVVNGVVSDVNADADMSEYKAAGASFEIRNTDYLTSVEYAASVSDQIDNPGATGISISGDVSFPDVTFTGGEGNELTVEFKNMGTEDDSYRGNVTLVNAAMAVTSGLYSGTVTAAAGSIQLTNADNFMIVAAVDDSGLEDVDVLGLSGMEAGEAGSETYYIHGAVTIATGTVTVGIIDVGDCDTDSLTVASGATLKIGEEASVDVLGNNENAVLTVDGTLAIDNGGFTVGTNATALVNGTVTVESVTTTQVNIDGKLIIDIVIYYPLIHSLIVSAYEEKILLSAKL